ncbi:hypothetical protein KI387_015441, partial [Taxus chinensis]
VASTTENHTTKSRASRLSHHHGAERCPTGAGGYVGDAAWDHAGAADRYRGTGYHITGPDNDAVGVGRIGGDGDEEEVGEDGEQIATLQVQ